MSITSFMGVNTQWLPFPLHVYQPSSFARGSYSWFPYLALPAAPVFLAFAPSRPGVHTSLCRGMLANTLGTKATSNLHPFSNRHYQIPFPDLHGHNTISVLTRVTTTCICVTDRCLFYLRACRCHDRKDRICLCRPLHCVLCVVWHLGHHWKNEEPIVPPLP